MKRRIRLTENRLNNIVTKSIRKVINENSASRKKYINRIYKYTRNLSNSIYRDNDWHYLRRLINAIGEVEGITNVDYWAENGGYRKDEEGNITSKVYNIRITTELGEDINGTITCSFCGTQLDPTDRYDMSLVIY